MSVLEEILFSSTQILPEWILFFGIITVAFVLSFVKKESKLPYYTFSIIIVLYLCSVIIYPATNDGQKLYNGLLHLDKLSQFIKQLAGISAIIFMVHARLFTYKYAGEVFVFVLFVLFGISFLSMTTHFMTLFVSLELVSLSSYVLVAMGKTKKNFEAGIKYLIFGATASAIMLFGISLFYGISHSLDFSSQGFAKALAGNHSGAVQVIGFFVLGGFLFKIAAAPFHQWVPDVYESTSTPVLSFLSFAPKAAGFVVIARLSTYLDLNAALCIVIVLTLIIGNLAALWQKDFKRLLGYSGIAQAGFMLVGLVKFNTTDFYGTFFYLATYLPITMGSFFLVDVIYRKATTTHIPALAGLGKKYPILGINTILIMIALVGLPPTVGFTSKLVVFTSLADTASVSGQNLFIWLLIFGLLNAAVSIYYYLKPVYYFLVKESTGKNTPYRYDFLLTLVLSYFGFIMVYLFLEPDFISQWIMNVLGQ
jgi:NADH-quinone oxidoreductase subunit N